PDRPHGFDIAVARDGSIAYRSNPQWPARLKNAEADIVWPLLPIKREHFAGTVEQPRWALLARHHGEPLREVIAAARRRDMTVAFAILVLLAASVISLTWIARRAERLRRQQL